MFGNTLLVVMVALFIVGCLLLGALHILYQAEAAAARQVMAHVKGGAHVKAAPARQRKTPKQNGCGAKNGDHGRGAGATSVNGRKATGSAAQEQEAQVAQSLGGGCHPSGGCHSSSSPPSNGTQLRQRRTGVAAEAATPVTAPNGSHKRDKGGASNGVKAGEGELNGELKKGASAEPAATKQRNVESEQHAVAHGQAEDGAMRQKGAEDGAMRQKGVKTNAANANAAKPTVAKPTAAKAPSSKPKEKTSAAAADECAAATVVADAAHKKGAALEKAVALEKAAALAPAEGSKPKQGANGETKDEKASAGNGVARAAAHGVSNGVSHVSNGISRVSNGVSHVSNGVLHVSNGVSHVSNGASHVSNGVSRVSNSASTARTPATPEVMPSSRAKLRDGPPPSQATASSVADATVDAAAEDGPRVWVAPLTAASLEHEEELRALFSAWGTVSAAKLKVDVTRASPGYGFIYFKEEKAVRALLRHVEGGGEKPLFLGQPLQVREAFYKGGTEAEAEAAAASAPSDRPATTPAPRDKYGGKAAAAAASSGHQPALQTPAKLAGGSRNGAGGYLQTLRQGGESPPPAAALPSAGGLFPPSALGIAPAAPATRARSPMDSLGLPMPSAVLPLPMPPPPDGATNAGLLSPSQLNMTLSSMPLPELSATSAGMLKGLIGNGAVAAPLGSPAALPVRPPTHQAPDPWQSPSAVSATSLLPLAGASSFGVQGAGLGYGGGCGLSSGANSASGGSMGGGSIGGGSIGGSSLGGSSSLGGASLWWGSGSHEGSWSDGGSLHTGGLPQPLGVVRDTWSAPSGFGALGGGLTGNLGATSATSSSSDGWGGCLGPSWAPVGSHGGAIGGTIDETDRNNGSSGVIGSRTGGSRTGG